MNLTSSLLALASQNFSSSLQDHVVGYSYCQEYYGQFPKSGDCAKAIRLLETGATEIPFAVHTGIGPHALPLSKNYGQSLRHASTTLPIHADLCSGTCMVQVDVAGPRLPATFNIAPNDIRIIANVALKECVSGPFQVGGFATSDLQVMNNWLTAEETKLDRPFPTGTAFLTVTLTNVVPDWLSPGNYDPIVAYHFSKVELDAIDRAYTRRLKTDLRERSERLLLQSQKMNPRGHRVPWWENPYLGTEGNETSQDTGSGTVSIEFPQPLASGANTATSRRRRRRS